MSTTPAEITRFSPEVVAAIYREAPTADPRQKPEPAKTSTQPSLSRIKRYTELIAGRWPALHASQSEADLEFCCYLAEATAEMLTPSSETSVPRSSIALLPRSMKLTRA